MLPEQQQRIMGYFIEEAKDHLNTIEQGLLNLQATIEDPEMANEVFRAAHSVKGGAAMLGIESVQRTAHRMEDYFKVLKESPIQADRALESMFLQVFDALHELLEQLQGPFGLTDDKAQEIMTGVEPVFGQLHDHLNNLVTASGGAQATSVQQPVASATPTRAASHRTAASSGVGEDSALQLVFKSDVSACLREMLSLFKQADTSQSRQALQGICHRLEQFGEQFELPAWLDLIKTARLALGHDDNDYRTLAPVLIKDIKSAQELVLSGRASEISVSEGIQSLLPEDLLDIEPDNADDLTDLFGEAEEQPLEGIDSVDNDFFAQNLASLDGLETRGAESVLELEADSDLAATDFQELLGDGTFNTDLTADVSNLTISDSDTSLDDLLSTGADPMGPEVGAAELNSLADLFEGDLGDLDDSWQEEEVAMESLHDASEILDVDISSDFADLLEDSGSSDNLSPSFELGDELADLFGEVLPETPDSSNETLGLESESDFLSLELDSTSDDLAENQGHAPESEIADLGTDFDLGFEKDTPLPSNDIPNSSISFSPGSLDDDSEDIWNIEETSTNELLETDLLDSATSELDMGSEVEDDTTTSNAALEGLDLSFDDSALDGLDFEAALTDEDPSSEPDISNELDDLDFEAALADESSFDQQDISADTGLDFGLDLDEFSETSLSTDATNDLSESDLDFGDGALDGLDFGAALTDEDPSNEPDASHELNGLGLESVLTDETSFDQQGLSGDTDLNFGLDLDELSDTSLSTDAASELGEPDLGFGDGDDLDSLDFEAALTDEGPASEPAVSNGLNSLDFEAALIDENSFDQEDISVDTNPDFGLDLDEFSDTSLSTDTDSELGELDVDFNASSNEFANASDLAEEGSVGFDEDIANDAIDADLSNELLDNASDDSLTSSTMAGDPALEVPALKENSFDDFFEADPGSVETPTSSENIADEIDDFFSTEFETSQSPDISSDNLDAAPELGALGSELEESDITENLWDNNVSLETSSELGSEFTLDNFTQDEPEPDITPDTSISEDESLSGFPSVEAELGSGVDLSDMFESMESDVLSDLSSPVDEEFDFETAEESQPLEDFLAVETELAADEFMELGESDLELSNEEVAIASDTTPDILISDSESIAEITSTELDFAETDIGLVDEGLLSDFDFSEVENTELDFGAHSDSDFSALDQDAAMADFDIGLPDEAEGFDAANNLEDFNALIEDNSEPTESENNLNASVGFDDLETLIDNPPTSSEFVESLDEAPLDEVSDDFNDLEALIDDAPASTAAIDDLDIASDDFDALDALIDDAPESGASLDASDTAASNDFDALEALIDDDVPEPTPLPSAAQPLDTDEFTDLEALLADDDFDNSPSPDTIESNSEPEDNEFEDLERLLEEADQTLGGPTGASTTRRTMPVANRLGARRGSGVLNEQTMRVSVKHLDNLSNLVGELVVNRNTLEQDQERLRQFLDNLLFQVQQLNDVGQRMRDLYERSLLESSLISSRQSYQLATAMDGTAAAMSSHATGETFDALEMDRFTGFHTLSQEMIELIVRVRESSSDIAYTVESSDQVTRQFRQVTTQLQEGLNKARMVPFAQTADRLPRAVRDISLKCGKEARLVVEGRDTLIDKMILEQLYDPMTHLVNNAITHGVETPDIRSAAGKPREGSITVRAFYQGNQTVIYVADDGGGIDPELVKQKAVQKGLISSAESKSMSVLDVYELLFHPGFSTRDQADDFAGRGVGMDVVRTSLAEIRGSITIDSELGKGTSFTIRLPLTLSISKALSCISNQARIAFPMDGVEDMFDVPRERIQQNEQGQQCILWRDTLLPFQQLSDLLKFNRTLGRGRVYGGHQDDDVISIVVLRSASTYIALEVDQVIGEQEIVIKQLEGPVPKPMGIAGATVLGDGRVMPIADVLELIDLAMGRVRRDPAAALWNQVDGAVPEEPAAVKSEPTVLIVDDSITVRELLSMSFNKVGYRVEQARDGQEAWEKLRAGLPCDLVFCDIEMPRMDGLELLSRMQKDNVLKRIPIAMLTSRGADRHRQMAVDLGASGYFTKPYLEEALLDAAQKMLSGSKLV